MKKISMLALAGAMLVVSGVSQAIVSPNFERPIMGATLSPVGQDGAAVGRATYLTLNQRDGAKRPTTLTLQEDTGIRCVTTPCPSTKETQFKITAVLPSFHSDVVRYEAVEILKNIPPNVRIARRRLNLTESSMELVAPGGGGFTRRTMWDVELLAFSQPTQTYSGQPQALASIALE